MSKQHHRPSHALPPGAWRFSPFTRRQEYVYEEVPVVVEPELIVSKPGPPRRTPESIEHGTPRGYKQHRRSDVPYCDACREAHAARTARNEMRRYLAGDPLFACECGARKNPRSKRCDECARSARRVVPQTERTAA